MVTHFTFVTLALIAISTNAFLINDVTVSFNQFRLKHNKSYKDQEEELKRFAIFKENVKKIEAHNQLYNQGLSTYAMGINQFTDLTPEEFEETLTLKKFGIPKFESSQSFQLADGVKAPDSIDWREKGVVTGVKDQGACGSCWAFSATGALESANGIKTGSAPSLSEQQLIDCSTDFGNAGCGGGFPDRSFNYVAQSGIQSDSSYPYTAQNGNCQYDSNQVTVRISSHVEIKKDENALKDAVGTAGPVSVLFDASNLQAYSNGIFDGDCTTTNLNHAVLAIGYGNENGNDFWIVKNSWGSAWGEGGYFRVKRGGNKCGISENCAYPVI